MCFSSLDICFLLFKPCSMGCVNLPSVESDYTSQRAASRGAEESPPSMSRVLEEISGMNTLVSTRRIAELVSIPDNVLYILNMSAILPARGRRKFLCSYSNFRRYPTSPQTTSRAPFFASESTTSVHRTTHGRSSFPKFKHSRKRPRSYQEDTSSSPNFSTYSIGNAKAYSANRGNTSCRKSVTTAIRNIQRVRTLADVESNLPLVISSIANPSLLAEEREWVTRKCRYMIVNDFFLQAFDIVSDYSYFPLSFSILITQLE